MSETLITAAQAAARLGVSSVTVRVWCKRGLFPNAELKQTAFGSGWLIPESDLKDFQPPKMGRPLKAKTSTASKASKKKSGKK
jgi:excisionase family DNA binding protein